MVTKPFLAARIPEDLNTKLEEHSASTGESRTQAVINALAGYLNFTPESKSEESAGDRLSLLEKKIAELENLIKEPKQFLPLENNASKISTDLEITLDNVSDNAGQDESFENGQGVINLDNNSDNTLDNASDNIQISIIDKVIQHPDAPHGKHLGQMKTLEVIALPGLEDEDPKKMKNKLNNSLTTKTKTTQIGSYTIVLSEAVKEAFPGKRREMLWDIYKNENKTSGLVINHDNDRDN